MNRFRIDEFAAQHDQHFRPDRTRPGLQATVEPGAVRAFEPPVALSESARDATRAVVEDHKLVPEGANGPFDVFRHRPVVRVMVSAQQDPHRHEWRDGFFRTRDTPVRSPEAGSRLDSQDFRNR